jgi:hypothetical protein
MTVRSGGGGGGGRGAHTVLEQEVGEHDRGAAAHPACAVHEHRAAAEAVADEGGARGEVRADVVEAHALSVRGFAQIQQWIRTIISGQCRYCLVVHKQCIV